MVERDPVQLLEALLTVCQVEAAPLLAIGTTLRRLLGQLTTEDTPNMTTPSARGDRTDNAARLASDFAPLVYSLGLKSARGASGRSPRCSTR
jgi:hypothetical protein